jgi:23S rRNA pseudouridine1911/1915/1917 synthase
MLHERTVPASAAGQRLDLFLEGELVGCTRSLIARLIKDGRCAIHPGKARAGYFLRGGEKVSLEVPEIAPMDAAAEDIPLTIIHEDEHLIVIDKPAGMVVHPAIGHPRGTLVNAVLGRYGLLLPPPSGDEDGEGEGEGEAPAGAASAPAAGQAWRPGVVHRLDQDTSGLILVARTAAALTFLQDAFKARQVHKRYLALVAGNPRADFMEHSGWLGRHPKDFRKRAVFPAQATGAKEAYTSFVVTARYDGYAVLEARPRTGRTHQIRVHLADLGHAVLADATYGRSRQWPLHAAEGAPALRRQGLHAWTLDIPHPAGGRRQFQAPIPADLARLIPRPPSPRPWH